MNTRSDFCSCGGTDGGSNTVILPREVTAKELIETNTGRVVSMKKFLKRKRYRIAQRQRIERLSHILGDQKEDKGESRTVHIIGLMSGEAEEVLPLLRRNLFPFVAAKNRDRLIGAAKYFFTQAGNLRQFRFTIGPLQQMDEKVEKLYGKAQRVW